MRPGLFCACMGSFYQRSLCEWPIKYDGNEHLSIIFFAFPAQAVYMGGIIHARTNTVMNWTFYATCRSLGLKSGVMHLTCPSIIHVYDSDRSKDAVTLRPKYNSLNQYSLENMK